MVDLLKLVKEQEDFVFPISAQHLSQIIKMVEEKLINKNLGLQLLDKTIESGKDPLTLAKEMGFLVSIGDEEIIVLLEKLKSENAKVRDDYALEPAKVEGFIVGYVMKNTGGKANAGKVKSLISKVFDK